MGQLRLQRAQRVGTDLAAVTVTSSDNQLIVDMSTRGYKTWLEDEMEATYGRPGALKQKLIRVATLVAEQWDLAQEKYGTEMSFTRFKKAVARCGVSLGDGTVFDGRRALVQHLRKNRKTVRSSLIKSIGQELEHDKQYLSILLVVL